METIEQMDLASIIAVFEHSSLSDLELSCSRFTVKMKRKEGGTAEYLAPPLVKKQQEKEMPAESEKKEEDLFIVTSPIVGTFYLTPAPDAPPYVHEGDKIEKGDVLCTIEAMKLMNQLQADFPCEIVSVLAKPEHMVEFGQPLFSVRRR
ncbi:acetyl-CoA carboxylase, biotin carboxyl carrier protein [Sphaerochaeta pleomorpha str. Grapes]|uniref:Biotin carboxyl carrier protein of acetyl-CoA carboxylase n=1 Tax=Sphaerochaeta pleomorpha (strain ATCC BAA-1885 / DSM 22778 / Grapes) TaxID=158190 RepID=G8QV62_SPHPG|nr:acetyl-CoA carboxylase biotin carboxyl carrier protein [Sphaerochaeta pleomorpha]AEV29298.1 acetyl-CoA carboxylase, biotin carboxyl carrier protein [Sphaerochaeta pleomorpha str. Grapes]